MKNADKPAMPLPNEAQLVNGNVSEIDGLTKREMFAMHAMNKCIEIHAKRGDLSCVLNSVAEDAVKCADALLAELEK